MSLENIIKKVVLGTLIVGSSLWAYQEIEKDGFIEVRDGEDTIIEKYNDLNHTEYAYDEDEGFLKETREIKYKDSSKSIYDVIITTYDEFERVTSVEKFGIDANEGKVISPELKNIFYIGDSKEIMETEVLKDTDENGSYDTGVNINHKTGKTYLNKFE